MSFSKTRAILFVLSISPLMVSCGQNNNDLIGTWTLASGANCPIDQITFKPSAVEHHFIAIGPNAPYTTTEAASYDTSTSGTVMVQGKATYSGSEPYIFTDKDHIKQGSNEACFYQRAS